MSHCICPSCGGDVFTGSVHECPAVAPLPMWECSACGAYIQPSELHFKGQGYCIDCWPLIVYKPGVGSYLRTSGHGIEDPEETPGADFKGEILEAKLDV